MCVCGDSGKGVQGGEAGDKKLAAIQKGPGFGGMGGMRGRWILSLREGFGQQERMWLASGRGSKSLVRELGRDGGIL